MQFLALRIRFFLFFSFAFYSLVKAQHDTTIYFFPGQGSDQRIFDSLTINGVYQKKYISYPIPNRKTNLKQFASELASQIDTTKPFILIGVSLGGMICCELSEILKAQKTIIISSAKNCSDLPFRYRFQKIIPIYKVIPPRLLRIGAIMMQPIVEPDRKHNKATFKSMLKQKKPKYIKRTIYMIMTWDRKLNSHPIYHIHGTKDHTLPIRKISVVDLIIKNGSHMMTLTRAKEISESLNAILKN